jgi:hypothetical protein
MKWVKIEPIYGQPWTESQAKIGAIGRKGTTAAVMPQPAVAIIP